MKLKINVKTSITKNSIKKRTDDEYINFECQVFM